MMRANKIEQLEKREVLTTATMIDVIPTSPVDEAAIVEDVALVSVNDQQDTGPVDVVLEDWGPNAAVTEEIQFGPLSQVMRDLDGATLDVLEDLLSQNGDADVTQRLNGKLSELSNRATSELTTLANQGSEDFRGQVERFVAEFEAELSDSLGDDGVEPEAANGKVAGGIAKIVVGAILIAIPAGGTNAFGAGMIAAGSIQIIDDVTQSGDSESNERDNDNSDDDGGSDDNDDGDGGSENGGGGESGN